MALQTYFMRKAATRAYRYGDKKLFGDLVTYSALLALEPVVRDNYPFAQSQEMEVKIPMYSLGTWFPWSSGYNFNIESENERDVFNDRMKGLVERCRQIGIQLTLEPKSSIFSSTSPRNACLVATFRPL